MKPFDSSGRLVLDGAQVPLRRVAVRGASATVFGQGVVFVVQMVATIFLARLLTPADFGLITMVTTFSLLVASCGLTGLTDAILHRNEIDHQLASNLFWIMIGVGVVLTAGFAATGSLLARLYGDGRVVGITAAISLTILFSCTSVLHLALLKRAMRFSAVSVNDIIARVISVAVSIVLAVLGWNYWALAVGAIAYPFASLIGAWSLCRWIPGLPRKARGTGSMLRFGAETYARYSVNYSSRNLDNLLVGWRFGEHSLGSYKKAYDLFLLPANQLVWPLFQVAVSTLSRLKADRDLFKQYFLTALSVLAFLGMGMGACLTLVGKDTIILVLGAKWGDAAHIFGFFGPGIGVMFLYATHGWLHISIGRPDRWIRWGIVEFTVTAMLFVGLLHWGPIGLAIAWTASFWILTIPAFWYAGKPIDLAITSILSVVWKYLVASFVAQFAAAWMVGLLRSQPLFAYGLVRIAVVSLVFVVLYILGVIALHGGLGPIYQLLDLAREILPLSKTVRSEVAAATPTPAIASGVDSPVPSKQSSNEPLVSILIPAFNAENWIAATLRSALGQTWSRKEIIIVDDGSSDRTVDVARQFEADGVRVVTQRNAGAAAARNLAFSLSHGEYIQWLDADDMLAPDKIKKQLLSLRASDTPRTLLSSEWGRFMYRYYEAKFTPTSLWCDLSPAEWLQRKLEQNEYMQTATWLVSRELTEAAGPWNTQLLGDDDGEYFSRVLLYSKGVRFVPDAKVYYRAPGIAFRSLSYIGNSNKKIEAQWISMKLQIGYLRSLDDSSRSRAACLQYLHNWMIAFYPERLDIVREAEQVAAELGGTVQVPPKLKWRYSLIAMLFGWPAAKQAQILLPLVRWTVSKHCEEALFTIETGSLGRNAKVGPLDFIDNKVPAKP